MTGAEPTHLTRTEAAVLGVEARFLGSEELDCLIRAGWDQWCDLLDDLISSGGMLPSRELARRTVAFFEDAYWRAEEARMEALRRRLEAEALHRSRGLGQSRGVG